MIAHPYERLSQERSGITKNVDRQYVANIRQIEDEGWLLGEDFRDNDLSASRHASKPRKDYLRLLEVIRATKLGDEARVIVINEVSRLFRIVLEAIELIQLSEITALGYIKVVDGRLFDLANPNDRYELINETNKAALESDVTSKREKRVRRSMAKEGLFNGGTRPYGYEGPIRDEHGRITNSGRIGVAVVAEEAEIIRESITRILAGWPLRSIALDLNKRGIPAAKGQPWQPTALRRILISPRIVGVRRHLDQEYPAEWPALVDRADWEQARLILAAESRRQVKGIRRYLLTGFAYCGAEVTRNGQVVACEKPLIAGTNSGKRRKQTERIYRCRRLNVYGTEYGCGKISRYADPVELFVADAVLKRYSSPNFAGAIKQAYQETGQDQAAALLDEAEGYRLRKQEIEAAYKTGAEGMGIDRMLRLTLDLDEEIRKVEAKLNQLSTGRILAAIPSGQSIYEAWDKADLHQRRALIGMIVKRVIILPVRAGGGLWTHERTGRSFQFDPGRVLVEWLF